ncbi:Tyrosine-protein phosphatase [Colletotrichum trifolii]|uniref:Tyrosine-protein phosphatase n=1 Tax=Colletotrichum trifolii TaxID=5466 RepID=A0A4R8QVY7_COLTR|nr:Tyrosine-protein phosphatase [Colletotrichum trifolii]
MASSGEYTPAKMLEIAATDVRTPLGQSDVVAILAKPPFISVPGTFNTRDIGLVPGSAIKPGFVFRTASLEALGDTGKTIISGTLGVRRIFDLRSRDERLKSPEPAVPGVENNWIPQSYNNSVDFRDFVAGGGEEGYCKMYLNMMEFYAPTFKAVLEHVRDRPGDPFLFHCTLGRDRTGIVAGLLQSLAGATSETLVLDYMITRIGSEPLRDFLLQRGMRDHGVESGLDDDVFYNLCNLKISTWELFMRTISDKYGGFEGYVTGKLGFTESEVDQIKKNLVS